MIEVVNKKLYLYSTNHLYYKYTAKVLELKHKVHNV